VVKSVQDGVHHDTSGPVEAMPLVLHVDGEDPSFSALRCCWRLGDESAAIRLQQLLYLKISIRHLPSPSESFLAIRTLL
jgi:hypothetical protein